MAVRSAVLLAVITLTAVSCAGEAPESAVTAAATTETAVSPASQLPSPTELPPADPPSDGPHSDEQSPEPTGIAAASAEATPSVAATAEPAGTTEPRADPAASVELAAPMRASAPVRVRIPAIAVDSTIMRLGLSKDRSLQVPPRAFPAGWYTGSPTPGEMGPAILAGHVDYGGQRGVFYDLRRLTTGDTVRVDREDGSTALFRVSRVQRFAKDEFPTKLVYGDIGWPGLRLITCGGAFDRKARSYVDNMVVFADLVDSA